MNEQGKGLEDLGVQVSATLHDQGGRRCTWVIDRYADDEAFARGDCFKSTLIEGNVLLNSGINELWDVLIGDSANTFSEANSRLGVSNDATAEDPTDTDLIGGSTYYGTMEASFPTVSAQAVSFKMVAGSGDGNFAWEEYVVKNNVSGICLNRKTSAQGTKLSGQVWTLTFSISLS